MQLLLLEHPQNGTEIAILIHKDSLIITFLKPPVVQKPHLVRSHIWFEATSGSASSWTSTQDSSLDPTPSTSLKASTLRGEPVSHYHRLLLANNGLLWGMVATYVQLLGRPGRFKQSEFSGCHQLVSFSFGFFGLREAAAPDLNHSVGQEYHPQPE